jgi:hypothetical protein
MKFKAGELHGKTVEEIERFLTQRAETDDAIKSLKEFELDPCDFETPEAYFYEVDVLCAYDKDDMTQEDFDRIFKPACREYWIGQNEERRR